MKIVIDEGIPYIRGIFEAYFEVIYKPGKDITHADVMDADALVIRTRTICNEKLLKNSAVKIICSATIGHDHIDKEYCQIAGIKWFTVPGCNAGSVGQYVLSALSYIVLTQKMSYSEMTVGIIGYGNVGKTIEKLCKTLEIKTLINDPPLQAENYPAQFTELNELLKKANIITFHTPLTKSGKYPTYHLLNAQSASCIQKGSIIINTSRGEVIDEQTLLNLYKEQIISHYILDVWENEPNINYEVLKNALIATPHIAGYSADGKYNGTLGCVKQICNFFNLPSLISLVPTPQKPNNSTITINTTNLSLEELLAKIVISTYSCQSDDILLRANPKAFETIRNNYPNRREYPAFEVKLNKDNSKIMETLYHLGFKTLYNS